MWFVFAIIVAALIAYASAKVPMEVTSIGVICALMLFFQLAPVDGDYERLSPARILQGFANPAFTVLALPVMGEGIARTGILDRAARLVLWLKGGRPWLTILISLAAVGLVYLLFVAPRLLPERIGFHGSPPPVVRTPNYSKNVLISGDKFHLKDEPAAVRRERTQNLYVGSRKSSASLGRFG